MGRYRSLLVWAAGLAGAAAALTTDFERPLYLDPNATVEERVADLLARMTLQEKVNQLLHPWPNSTIVPFVEAAYGATGVGALYGYDLTAPGESDVYAGRNALQASIINSSRLGIPITYVSETLHSSDNNGTAFPAPVLLGATWDPALVESIGAVIAAEARVSGITRGFAPVLQVATDPRFGRFEEAYGEDPLLVSAMGVAMIRGQQGGATGGPSQYINSTAALSNEAKHAVAYAQSGRDWYTIQIDDRSLWDIYLRPWKAAIQEAGLRGLMVTHPAAPPGLPMHGNGPILSGILRGTFGGERMYFASDANDIAGISSHGITVDDAGAGAYALTAGMDQELVTTTFPSLVDSVLNGTVPESAVDAAAARILREKFALRLFDGPEYWMANATAANALKDCPAHRQLAYQAAAQGIVLLQNNPPAPAVSERLSQWGVSASSPVLPLPAGAFGSSIRRVALLGPNGGCVGDPTGTCAASSAYRGGYCAAGSHTVTLYEALAEAAAASTAAGAPVNVTYTSGVDIMDYNTSGIADAVAAAADADLAVIVVGDTTSGYSKGSCAEGIDADTIDLPGGQLLLIDAVLANTSTPVVVVLVHGRPATFGAGPFAVTGANNALLARIPALLASWRPGEEGGHAIWDIITGAVNPSGRLAQNWVRGVGAIRGPANPYLQPRGNPTRGYVTEPATPLFYLGYGLSYNAPRISSTQLVPPAGGWPLNGSAAAMGSPSSFFNVSGTLQSVGPAGTVVVQVYASQAPPTKYVRYGRQLVAWAKVPVSAGTAAAPASADFSISVAASTLAAYDPEAGDYVVYAGNYSVSVGLDSSDEGQAKTWNAGVPVEGFPWSRPRFPGMPTRVIEGMEVGVGGAVVSADGRRVA